MKTLLLTITIAVFYSNIYAQSTITRGTEPGEIYISSNWYVDNQNEMHTAIWRSTDNGQTLNLQYRSTGSAPNGEMGIGKVLGDATPGTLYNIAGGELWVSFDYGVSWEYIEFESPSYLGNYCSGCYTGEIYKIVTSSKSVELFRSINFGSVFDLQNNNVGFICEVGTESNEIYLNYLPFLEDPYKIYYSNNNGVNFNLQCELDTSIAGTQIGGNYTQISRGSTNGELYLIGWHLPSNYYIYYSSDYGQTFQFQYQSEECDFFYWNYYFTAGREPGSFYVKRIRPTEDTQHMLMYIDYSADSAQTFTTYFHDLVETYSVEEIEEIEKIGCYPNPFGITTTFNLPKELMNDNSYIEIFDRNGKLLKKIESNSNRVRWDGTNNQGNKVANGVYFYRIKSANSVSKLNKIIFLYQ